MAALLTEESYVDLDELGVVAVMPIPNSSLYSLVTKRQAPLQIESAQAKAILAALRKASPATAVEETRLGGAEAAAPDDPIEWVQTASRGAIVFTSDSFLHLGKLDLAAVLIDGDGAYDHFRLVGSCGASASVPGDVGRKILQALRREFSDCSSRGPRGAHGELLAAEKSD